MSSITVVNNSQEVINVVIFKKSINKQVKAIVPWESFGLTVNGSLKLELPDNYQISVTSSDHPAYGTDLISGLKTELLKVNPDSNNFIVRQKNESHKSKRMLELTAVPDKGNRSELKVTNQTDRHAYLQIAANGINIHPLQYIDPYSTFTENIYSPAYLVLANDLPPKEYSVDPGAIISTPYELKPDSTVYISGNSSEGFTITNS